MNGAALHLLLNHLPLHAALFGLIFMAVALVRRSESLTRIALIIFVAAGLVALPAYFSGEPAEEVVEHLEGVSHDTVEEHEEAGKLAIIAMVALGAAAAAALVVARRRGGKLPRWGAPLTLALAVIGFAIVARTAHLGGKIRHPELDPPARDPVQGELGHR